MIERQLHETTERQSPATGLNFIENLLMEIYRWHVSDGGLDLQPSV
jgi:hypothetical protein